MNLHIKQNNLLFKNSVNESERFKTRYYEFESISYPYAKKCCENGLETTRQCAQNAYTPQQGLFSITTCSSSLNDVACCDADTDCVYSSNYISKCYPDDGDYSRADITVEGVELVCTSKHWCPINFEYNPIYNRCEYQKATCHIDTGINTGWCYTYTSTYPTLNYPYIQDPENCLLDLQSPPLTLPYEQSCCYDFSLMTTNFYSWENVKIYDTQGILVSLGIGPA